MAINYPGCEVPDGQVKIWHYMDFWKFQKSIQERSSLFFACLRVLKEKEDEFEGQPPIEDQKRIGAVDAYPRNYAAMSLENQVADLAPWTAVSCWTIAESESCEMWQAYTTEGKPRIAIQSTVSRLQASFESKRQTTICKVRYIDRENDPVWGRPAFPLFNKWDYVFHKGEEFAWENELRAARYLLTPVDEIRDPEEYGVYVPVECNLLLEGIVVSDQALLNSVRSALQEKALDVEVALSTIVPCSSSV